LRRLPLLGAGLLLVCSIAILDHVTGPLLSHGILYLVPVAICAWWAGFPHGILIALSGSVAWYMVDYLEDPSRSPAAAVWNGVVRFSTMAVICSLVSRLHASVLRERWLARTDPLTGASNGRTFYEVAAAEAERASRTGRPLTLAYLDLDNFKQLNDRLGHAAGDETLVQVVHLVHDNLRGLDLFARLGGDEFALLLPETGSDGARTLLARIQEVLTREMNRKGLPVTFSIGALTFLRPVWDVDFMIRRVDSLMYAAKKKGKGLIEHTVVEDGLELEGDQKESQERRAVARLLCSRVARVRREGCKEEFATLRDLSIGGVGLFLENRLPLDALLIIEPLFDESKSLLARVVHVTSQGDRWMHGCALSSHLSQEELESWIGARSLLECARSSH
jgi:diguanylate cyclase (GGDEF)-like protein